MVAVSNEKGALACTYAALLLHDEGAPITADSIKKVVAAAGVDIEPYWPGLFATLLQTVKIGDLINNIGSAPVASGPVAAAPAAASGGAAAPAKEEKKKDEPVEEEDGDMGFSLFD